MSCQRRLASRLIIMKQYYVYILASGRNGTLYTGMTNNIARRIDEHRDKAVQSFTEKYSVHKLVYYEVFDSPEEAIRREKNIKAWKRAWKLRLVESTNVQWEDLSQSLLQ